MIFASDLSLPEAPLLLGDGGWLLVEMGADRGSVTYLSHDGRQKRIVARTGRPNGLASDGRGGIWVAETWQPALLRMDIEGHTDIFAAAGDGEPFLWPNDLAFGPDGALYMTDSGIRVQDLLECGRIRPDYGMLPFDGRVYRIDTQRREVRRLDSGLRFANGIAFGPDGGLYVTETLTGRVYRYALQGDGSVARREEFAAVLQPGAPTGFQGPDGGKFAVDGSLYVAVFGQGHVARVTPDGAVAARLWTAGALPTNLAFGPPGECRIYITEDEYGAVEALDVGVDGLPLYAPAPAGTAIAEERKVVFQQATGAQQGG